jgi:hypothetical protein
MNHAYNRHAYNFVPCLSHTSQKALADTQANFALRVVDLFSRHVVSFGLGWGHG